MINDLISVIVPVYNVEKYLPSCIESIINQTYKNLEIILVDDGSSDNCGKICDEYAKKDTRIKVIHKENGGVSRARNIGIEAANGKFILFVDSDDFLENNGIEILITKQIQKNYDFVCGKCTVVTRKGERQIAFCEKTFFADEVPNNILDVLSLSSMMAPWAKLYRNNIIKDNKLCFPEGISKGEDSIFVVQYIDKIKSMALIDQSVCYYNCMEDDTATGRFHMDFNKYSKIFTDILKTVVDKTELKTNGELDKYMINKVYWVLDHYLYKAPNFRTTVEGIKNTINIYKDDIRFELFKEFFSNKQVEYLENSNFKKFVFSWRMKNLSKICKLRIKSYVKKHFYKFKNK